MQSILKIKTKSTFVHNNREPEIWFSFLTFYIKFVIIHLCIFLHVALIPYSLLNQGFNYIRFLVKTFLNEKGGNQTMQKAYKVISATSDGFFRKVRAFFIACAKRNELPSTRNVFNYLVPLCVFIFLWANDTGAYCCGSLLGRHKLFPRISPGKSWEGSIGGAVIVLIVAYFIGRYEAGLNSETGLTVLQWMGLGLVVVVFGTWGDLVESLFKRTLGIKDSGNILPGHGGMLDRFDSSLMAMPASVIYLYSLTLF